MCIKQQMKQTHIHTTHVHEKKEKFTALKKLAAECMRANKTNIHERKRSKKKSESEQILHIKVFLFVYASVVLFLILDSL